MLSDTLAPSGSSLTPSSFLHHSGGATMLRVSWMTLNFMQRSALVVVVSDGLALTCMQHMRWLRNASIPISTRWLRGKVKVKLRGEVVH
jgi:hypothetical protein